MGGNASKIVDGVYQGAVDSLKVRVGHLRQLVLEALFRHAFPQSGRASDSATTPKDTSWLIDAGITHVLSIVEEPLACEIPRGIQWLRVCAPDFIETDLRSIFPAVAAFIADGRAHGAVLVHCRLGISRSSACIAAYLIAHLQCQFSDALDLMKRRRIQAFPNIGFREQLESFATDHRLRKASSPTHSSCACGLPYPFATSNDPTFPALPPHPSKHHVRFGQISSCSCSAVAGFVRSEIVSELIEHPRPLGAGAVARILEEAWPGVAAMRPVDFKALQDSPRPTLDRLRTDDARSASNPR